ncbi:IST1-like protein [Tanacetum coccineum]
MAAFRKGVEAETSGRTDDLPKANQHQSSLRIVCVAVEVPITSNSLSLVTMNTSSSEALSVDQVIKVENVLDVYVMLDDYCHLVLQMFSLIEQEKDCPDELKEAASSLLYAAPRCGEFSELQEIRVVLTARYGKEFSNGAIDLRNNLWKSLGEGEFKTNVIETNLSVSADDFDEVLRFTESRKGRNKYRNAEDAAQDVFESAAYAAACTTRAAA